MRAGVLRVVRCADRVPVDRGQLHERVGAVVEGTGESGALPIHGQRQRAVPLGHLSRLSARHRRQLHAHQPAAITEYALHLYGVIDIEEDYTLQ